MYVPKISIGLLATIVLFAACGSDDGASVTKIDEGGASVTDTGSSTGSEPANDKPCQPIGEDLEAGADQTLAIELADYFFGPSAPEVDEGTVTFETTNAGNEPHELAFLPGGGAIPITDTGELDEDALAAAGAFELEAFAPGLECNATYELAAGEYTLFCAVTSPDGTHHYDKGMQGLLVVRP